MADLKRFELEDLAARPGTYYHPETEVVIIVDDSGHADAELLGGAADDDGEWVLVSDEIPVDEHRRDELLEALQVRATRAAEREDADEDEPDEEDELEPDEQYDEDDY
jgi:hypothetical protein